MSSSTIERVEAEAPPAVAKIPMGDYATIQGTETKLTLAGKAIDLLRSLDFRNRALALTAVGVTAMGLTPILISRDITTAGAVVPCLGIVVLGVVGFTAILTTKRDSRGTNSKDNTNQPTHA